MKSRVVLAFVLAVCCASAEDFHWGVNGHPFQQEGYRAVPLAEQLALLTDLGVGWYRNDWSQARFEAAPDTYDAFIEAAARKGIHILPVIFPSLGSSGDAAPEAIRAASRAFARTVASRYKGKITHWELANERDNLAMIRKGERDRNGRLWEWGDPAGNKPEHYEEGRYQKVKAELLGLYEGIKEADPEALTIVDSGGWLHYGFFERLVHEDNVPFDILGWHWYSEMGALTREVDGVHVLEQLKSYGKPIWVTEINRRSGSLGGKFHEQAQYLVESAKQALDYPGVDAFFAYELLDEPYFGADNPESHYGLVEIVKGLDRRWRVRRKKEAFEAYRAIITGNRFVNADNTKRPAYYAVQNIYYTIRP